MWYYSYTRHNPSREIQILRLCVLMWYYSYTRHNPSRETQILRLCVLMWYYSYTRHNPSREIQILRLCQGHPNIVRLVDVFTDQLHVYIVMELVKGGELLERLQRRHSFTEQQASVIFKQLVSAVAFMHQKNVVHRDLKPEVSDVYVHIRSYVCKLCFKGA